MIPERNQNTVTSTVTGEVVEMAIAADATAHIMGILSEGLYSDPEMAIVREYATNAADSHAAAGQSAPIEISTPTNLRPIYSVRDYGIGMDVEDIRSIYSQYGASTKRGTNDAVGMLGLGCKSAFAYADQFTVTGVKDGERIVVSVSRDAEGAGSMTVLESGPTDAPNGVEIAIPTKRDNQLARKAAEFFAHWPAGSVLVDGKEPAPLEGVRIGDRFLITDSPAKRRHNGYGPIVDAPGDRFTVVQGGVPYPAPDDFEHEAIKTLPEGRALIARVPIGTVNFAPSREALVDHPSTRAALEGALTEFLAQAAEVVARRIGKAKTPPEAAAALIELRGALGAKAVPEGTEWNGAPIPEHVSYVSAMKYADNQAAGVTGERMRRLRHGAQAGDPDAPKFWQTYSSYGRQSDKMELGKLALDSALNSLWVLGFDNASWTPTMRRKLDAYCAYEGINYSGNPVLTTADYVPMTNWLDGEVQTLEWETVRKWKDPNKPAAPRVGGQSYAGTYPAEDVNGYLQRKMPAADIAKAVEDGATLYYFQTGNYDHRTAALREFAPGKVVIAMMPDTRAAKFLRTFPTAKDGAAALKSLAEKWARGLTKDQRLALALVGQPLATIQRFQSLPAAKIQDRKLRRLLELNATTKGNVRDRYLSIAHLLPKDLQVDGLRDKLTSDVAGIFKAYPLLEAWPRYGSKPSSDMIDQTITYINAVHKKASK